RILILRERRRILSVLSVNNWRIGLQLLLWEGRGGDDARCQRGGELRLTLYLYPSRRVYGECTATGCFALVKFGWCFASRELGAWLVLVDRVDHLELLLILLLYLLHFVFDFFFLSFFRFSFFFF